MAEKKIPVRILAQCFPDGVEYQPNQLVSFPEEQAKQLKEEGMADDSKGAVDYCLKIGAKAIEHAVPAAPVEQE